MPLVRGFPTWKNINAVNSISSSGQTDNMTGEPYYGEGLYLGVYADMTNEEAMRASNPNTALLYNGRYRYVQVDSGATAAYVQTGTVGFIRAGSTVKSVVVLTQGSGQTVGSYNVSANLGSGGGSGAVIQVTVTGAAAITVVVLNPGFGYVSPPTFTLATGGTPGTVVAQLGLSENIVTSADIAIGAANAANAGIGPVHPVVFLNAITPGNYGFIQESGVATVISAAAATQTASQNALVSTSSNGSMIASNAGYNILNIGIVVDPITAPLVGTPFKIQMTTPIIQD